MTTNNPNTTVYSINFGADGIYTPEQISLMKIAFEEIATAAGFEITEVDDVPLSQSLQGTPSTTQGTTSSTTHGPTPSFHGPTSSTTHGPTPSFPGPTPSFPGTTSSTTHGPTPSFPGPTPSAPSTTPSFNFSVDVIANEIARGANIVQWGIIEDELTAERIDAIKNIINDTINNS
jgi:hypothetical protein